MNDLFIVSYGAQFFGINSYKAPVPARVFIKMDMARPNNPHIGEAGREGGVWAGRRAAPFCHVSCLGCLYYRPILGCPILKEGLHIIFL